MKVFFDLFIKSTILVFVGVFIYLSPYIFQEVRYLVKPYEEFQVVDNSEESMLDTGSSRVIKPVDTDFGIIVPKLGISAAVLNYEDMGDFSEEEKGGVYKVSNSYKPGSLGEVILHTFASKSELMNRKSATYYLLHRLKEEDNIILYYKDDRFDYQIVDKEVVPADAYDKYQSQQNNELRLVSNWPPGMSSQKIIIYATQVN
ncbi:sortase [Patescibacteria group bacterium]